MKVLVCGGRDYDDYPAVAKMLGNLSVRPSLIIHGAARGADTLAAKWAVMTDTPIMRFPADWQRDGKAAGPIRNSRMLAEGRPDLVVAFPGGRGTADMVAKARKAGVPVIVSPTHTGATHDQG